LFICIFVFDIQIINSNKNGSTKNKKSQLQRFKKHLQLFVRRRRFSDGEEMFTQTFGHSIYRLADFLSSGEDYEDMVLFGKTHHDFLFFYLSLPLARYLQAGIFDYGSRRTS
jgi:hypothetical protein